VGHPLYVGLITLALFAGLLLFPKRYRKQLWPLPMLIAATLFGGANGCIGAALGIGVVLGAQYMLNRKHRTCGKDGRQLCP
jgi:hypothetical protein